MQTRTIRPLSPFWYGILTQSNRVSPTYSPLRRWCTVDSVNLFESKQIRRPVRVTSLWLIMLTSLILPGLGHWLLGRGRLGLCLMLSLIPLQAGALAAGYFQLPHLVWLATRLIAIVFCYAVIDASLTRCEIADRRPQADPSARFVAFLNLCFYGAGYWMIDLKVPAIAVILLALPLHGWIAGNNLLLTILVEVVVALWAVHGMYEANRRGQTGPTRKLQFATSKPADTTPSWLIPGLTAHTGLMVGLVLATLGLGTVVMETMQVDQSTAVSVEPYYKNPAYGVNVEMNAPGWTFRTAADNELVVAQHLSEDSIMRLSMQPRLPGIMSNEDFAFAALAEASARGYNVTPHKSETRSISSLEGQHLTASAIYRNEVREINVITAGKGMRQYVLWFEWGIDHERFARREMEYLLTRMEVD